MSVCTLFMTRGAMTGTMQRVVVGRVWGVIFVWGFAATLSAADAPKVTYDDHIKPLFREHCLACHNADKAKGDLKLDSYAGLMQGGSSGAVVEPGDLDASRLWALTSHKESPSMPPMQPKLADAKLALLEQWIRGGALENAGAKAAVKKKPDLALAAGATGAKKPDGPPPMPQGVVREPVVRTPRTGQVTALAASPWAPLIAVAGHRQVLLYHSESGELLGVLPFLEGVPHVLKFSRNGSLLIAGGGQGAKQGRVAVYDVKTGRRVTTVGEELDLVLAADINDTHTQIALAGPQRIVRVYNTADGSLVHEIRKHTDWVYAVEFSPDGVLLATADRSGGLFVWEAETAREFYNLQGHNGPVQDVSWRGDANVLASAGEDGTVRLWEMNEGKPVKSWGAHGGGVAAVEFAKDGRIVSCGRDRTVKLWDGNGAAQKSFGPLADLALECAISHDGLRVAGGDWAGNVALWNVADAKPVASLATNPPTLEMRLAAAQAAVPAAEATLAAAQADAAKLKLVAEDKAKLAAAAVKNHAEVVAGATAADMKRQQAEQAATAAQTAANVASEKSVAAKNAAEQAAKAAVPKAAVPNAAVLAEQAAAAAQTYATAATQLAAARKVAAEAAATVKAMAAQVTAAKTTVDQANAAKAEADKALAPKAAVVAAAEQQVRASKAVVDQAQQELKAYTSHVQATLTGEASAHAQAAAAKTALEKLAAEQAALEKQVAAQAAAAKQAAAALAALQKTAAEKQAAAQAAATAAQTAQSQAETAAARRAELEQILKLRGTR